MSLILASNLVRLEQALRSYARGSLSCAERLSAPDPDCVAFAHRMPLAHARGGGGFRTAVDQGALLSARERSARGLQPIRADSVEVALGTEDDVFTYAGPPVFPNRFGLLFRAQLEQVHPGCHAATPFDSGGLVNYLRPSDTHADRVAFLRAHELPAPAYRSYFELVLASLYGDPKGYVDGMAPDPAGPMTFECCDVRAWTFEVRFRRRIDLHEELLALFLPISDIDAEWLAADLSRWEESGVEIAAFDPTNGMDDGTALLAAGRRFLHDYLDRTVRT